MLVKSPRYKEWKKHQNEKNLIRRTKRKRKHKNTSNNINKKKQPAIIFQAPINFSIINNPQESINFLNILIKKTEAVRTLYHQRQSSYIRNFLIDMSATKMITCDALMYLLTIIQNTRGKKILPINWIGNFPKDEEVKEYLKKSGYLKYMKTAAENIVQVDDNIQIKNGMGYSYIDNDVSNDIRREIIDFSCLKLNRDKTEINYLMTMLTEMITNIRDHAYQKEGLFKHEWYIFVDNKKDVISYTFMDNGLGIPTTIKKSIKEKIFEYLNFENEYKYIETAIYGIEKRSETGKRERGNGLPSIYEQFINKKVSNFVIISNKAFYGPNNKYDLKEGLFGTIFYWEIKKEDI